jgi:hypothetical protein
MKLLFALAAIYLFCTAEKCNSSKQDKVNGTFKGRLEIQGICMNYTLSLLEENADTSLVTPTWKDEHSGKTYKNVFGLANPCDFPKELKVGDEFSFSIDTAKGKDCMVCMAYYPTPPKKLSIKISKN